MLRFLAFSCIVLFAFSESDYMLNEDYDSGYLGIENGENLFYVLFRARSKNPNAPLVLWMPGGPGCAIPLAIHHGNGPFRLSMNRETEEFTLTSNTYSWNTLSDIVYIDNPLGTGFSYYKDIAHLSKDEDSVSKNLYLFYQNLLSKFPELVGRDLYLGGQSYSGKFVPSVANYLLNQGVKVSGIYVGNGWVSPQIQMLSYSKFTYERGLSDWWSKFTGGMAYQLGSLFIKLGWMNAANFMAQNGNSITTGGSTPVFDMYDVRKLCANGGCDDYTFAELGKWMNKPGLRKAWNVEREDSWVGCSPEVFAAMMPDDYFADNRPTLVNLLDVHKINVMITFGKDDWICNYEGGLRYLNMLGWKGKDRWINSPWRSYFVNGEEKGQLKEYENLVVVTVEDSGHEIISYQPSMSFDMISSLQFNQIVQ
eukprot:TRINITY_DN1292_c0_g2_i5.p1 TRINITY_DN1292_c0_g2~~TRINITY_DN1292_c0_g2_i5.p1  ORF type:complete len:423 (+),score=39.89 TRINITY_DN1292_c0_g2_i5:3-1271(+)